MTASTSSATPARGSLALPIAAGCCVTAAALYVAALDPSSSGTFPTCPFRSVTGWWCPGCGLTLATHHLLRGDVTQALGYNALVVPVLAMLVLTWGTWLMATRGLRPPWVHLVAVPAWCGLAIVAVAFSIVRNLESFDALRG